MEHDSCDVSVLVGHPTLDQTELVRASSESYRQLQIGVELTVAVFSRRGAVGTHHNPVRLLAG